MNTGVGLVCWQDGSQSKVCQPNVACSIVDHRVRMALVGWLLGWLVGWRAGWFADVPWVFTRMLSRRRSLWMVTSLVRRSIWQASGCTHNKPHNDVVRVQCFDGTQQLGSIKGSHCTRRARSYRTRGPYSLGRGREKVASFHELGDEDSVAWNLRAAEWSCTDCIRDRSR